MKKDEWIQPSQTQTSDTELCMQSMLCLCHRAKPPAEPSMQKESHEETHKETSRNNLDLRQNQDFFLWLGCWLLASKLQRFQQGSGVLPRPSTKDQGTS